MAAVLDLIIVNIRFQSPAFNMKTVFYFSLSVCEEVQTVALMFMIFNMF